jgi:hypothetical protein
VNYKICNFYRKDIFRKLKLNGYINRKRSEQRMITNFKKQFGSGKDTIVCIGDYEQKKHMKVQRTNKRSGNEICFEKSRL